MKKILALAVLLIFAVSILSGCTSICRRGPGIHTMEVRLQSPRQSTFKILRWRGSVEASSDIGRNDILAWGEGGEAAEYCFISGNVRGHWLSQVDVYIDQDGPRRANNRNPCWGYQWGYSFGRGLGAGDHLIRVTATYTSPEGLEPIVQERQFWLHICPDRACHWWVVNP